MKSYLPAVLCLFVAAFVRANAIEADQTKSPDQSASADEAMDAQPKLLRISGMIDGSGRLVLTRQGVSYEHKHWSRPTEWMFDGEPWPNPGRTPPAWREVATNLDLTRAWLVKRQGRDVIALERFDLYLSDSPNGAAKYEVTIAIPRRR